MAKKILGLHELALSLEDLREPARARQGIGMLHANNCLQALELAAAELFRLHELTLRVERGREVPGAGQCARMPRAQLRLAPPEHTPLQALRIVRLPQGGEELRKAACGRKRLGVLGAELRLLGGHSTSEAALAARSSVTQHHSLALRADDPEIAAARPPPARPALGDPGDRSLRHNDGNATHGAEGQGVQATCSQRMGIARSGRVAAAKVPRLTARRVDAPVELRAIKCQRCPQLRAYQGVSSQPAEEGLGRVVEENVRTFLPRWGKFNCLAPHLDAQQVVAVHGDLRS
mmetsp:Transcript_66709/g.214915  ORF Transcript_66709/g.214915 Transcript_66709/m.214915 type:complete len:290 (-) Transcript_66709:254-1123(-)